MPFEVCKYNNSYEISTEYPYEIRKISTHRVVKVSNSYNGYQIVCLGGKTIGLHKVVATQWLENPNNLPEVNHKDSVRNNNHVENLEWISHSDNLRQREAFTRRNFEFVEALPETAFQLTEYKGFSYDKYWFDNTTETLFIKAKRQPYRIVHPSDNHGRPQVTLYDVESKAHAVFWSKFIKVMKQRNNTAEQV